jgi:hypothetical protein
MTRATGPLLQPKNMKTMRNRYYSNNSLPIRPRTTCAVVFCTLTAALVSILGLSGCDRHDSSPPTSQIQTTPAAQNQTPTAALRDAGNGKSNLRQVIVLNRLAKQDPAHLSMDRATITDQNDVGVNLSKNVEMDKVPDLMRSIVDKLGQEFPEEDLTIAAYVSDPPHRAGKAHRDAKTKETSYTPEPQ